MTKSQKMIQHLNQTDVCNIKIGDFINVSYKCTYESGIVKQIKNGNYILIPPQ